MRERQIGLALIGIGALALLTRLLSVSTGWLWVGAVAVIFLAAYARKREPGLLVPGGILAGISLGILLEELPGLNDVFLFGLASGFFLIYLLEPRVHRWTLWPGSILSVIAVLVLLESSPWLFAGGLILLGLWIMNHNRAGMSFSTSASKLVATVGSGPTGSSPRTDSAADTDTDERFAMLASWRAKRSSELGIIPTDLIRNDQLAQLARTTCRREDLEQLLDPKQFARYGAEILELMHASMR